MIIITGMHRSGTSMLSHLVQKMGGDFGPEEELIGADRWNQDGYLENVKFVEMNNKLILGLNSNVKYWAKPETSPVKRLASSIISGKFKYLLFPTSFTIEKRAVRLNSQLGILAERFKNKVIKDPRFSLTLGSWQSRADIEGVIFCFRNPDSVRKSIEKRDLMPNYLANRFWLYHHQLFFDSLEGDRPVLLVNFDDFFNSRCDAQLLKIEHFLRNNCNLPVKYTNAGNVIDRSKRHHDGDELLSNARGSMAFKSLFDSCREHDTGMAGCELREQLRERGFPR